MIYSSSVALSARVAKNFSSRNFFTSFSRVPDVAISNRVSQRQHVGICGVRNNVGGTATLREEKGFAFTASVGRMTRQNIFDSNSTILRAFSASAEKVAAQPTAAATSDDDNNGGAPLGTVTYKMRKLDKSVVQKLKEELKEVDANSDDRLDAGELAELLKRTGTFTDEEIVECTELFYAGKAGGSLSMPDFIATLDSIASGKNHPILDGNCSAEYIYRKTHHAYTLDELDIELTHEPPKTTTDKVAYQAVKLVRGAFDLATGWKNDDITKPNIMNRVIFLETIAAVPGMVAGVIRHLRSLRKMERDGGLVQLFLEEANNERMHLLSFIKLKNPGMLFRAAVLFSQVGFGTVFFLAYVVSPQFCHRFVGYVEEEACSTYTKIVKAIEKAPEGSDLASWRTERAPKIAIGYWKLGEDGSILDLMYAVRADEAEHRDVNHTCSDMTQTGSKVNPFNDPELKINTLLRKYIKDMMTRNEDEGKKNLTSR